MSRLIYDDNLISKFGSTIPNPIIEEVRVYDDRLECDLSYHIRISSDEDETENIIKHFRQSDLLTSVGPTNRSMFEEVKNTNSFFTLVNENYKKIDIFSFKEVDRDVYDKDGNRYAKLFYTETFNFIGSLELNDFDYLNCFSYHENVNDLAENFDTIEHSISMFVKNQTSDLSYTRCLNNDKTIFDQKVDVFIDSSDSIYDQEVLYSLKDTYHKAIGFTKNDIFNGINGIIKSYSSDLKQGTAIEILANNLLFVLQKDLHNPKFLSVINTVNKSSPNKDFSLPVGKLYRDVNIFVSNANRRIISQEELQIQKLSGIKIVDYREDFLRIDLTEDGLELPTLSSVSGVQSYILQPLITRTTERGRIGNSNQGELFNVNDSIFYFDYEKALNYRSEISKFINPNILMQSFGNRDLTRFFKITGVRIEKFLLSSSSSSRIENGTLVSSYILEPDKFSLSRDKSLAITEYAGRGSLSIEKFTIFTDPERSEVVTHIAERVIDSIERKGNYEIRAYNHIDIQSLETWNLKFYYEISYFIEDTTMLYYDLYVRQSIMNSYEKLKYYYDYASEFCSYNNIDEVFNDFFVEGVRETFTQPYPWIEAPFYYVMLNEVLKVEPREIYSNEKKKQTILKLNDANRQSYIISDSISPEKGSLRTIRRFLSDFAKFIKSNFVKSRGLDKRNEIYNIELEYVLKNPNVPIGLKRAFSLPNYINDSEYFIDSVKYSYLQPFGMPSETGVQEILLQDYQSFLEYFSFIRGEILMSDMFFNVWNDSRNEIVSDSSGVYMSAGENTLFSKLFLKDKTTITSLFTSLSFQKREELKTQTWTPILSLLLSSYTNSVETSDTPFDNFLNFIEDRVFSSFDDDQKLIFYNYLYERFNEATIAGQLSSNNPSTNILFIAANLPEGSSIRSYINTKASGYDF